MDDILDTTKLESGTVVLEERPFDLLEVLDEIIAMVEPQAAEAGVEFTSGRGSYTIPHRHLVGSPAHLNRILANLVTNAVKYNRPGGTVHSSIEELSCDGETITYRFVCADTGIGMSKEFQARAFELFARENRDASVTGTGLGLAIVKELAELMGGAVRLESEEGAGSTFTVDIPFKLDLASDEGQAPEPSPEQVDLRGRRALLVEDNDLNLEIALMMLQDMGLDCDVARNGKEAVEVFAASEDGFYDLVFMDVMMPVMNGLDAARSIRALGGNYARGGRHPRHDGQRLRRRRARQPGRGHERPHHQAAGPRRHRGRRGRGDGVGPGADRTQVFRHRRQDRRRVAADPRGGGAMSWVMITKALH